MRAGGRANGRGGLMSAPVTTQRRGISGAWVHAVSLGGTSARGPHK